MYGRNTWRKLADGVLSFYLVVGEIVVFILSIYFGKESREFGMFLITAVIGSLIVFLSALMMGLFVEAVRHLESIDEKLGQLKGKNGVEVSKALKSQNPDWGSTYTTLEERYAARKDNAQTVIKDGKWFCSNCGERNGQADVYCKSCGKHR